MNNKRILILGVISAIIGYLTFTSSGNKLVWKGYKMLSENGLALLKSVEGFSSRAYWDVKGWSIGFGHFMGATKLMDNITMQQAIDLLNKDLIWVENAIKKHVKVPLTQNQHDALVSFIYNVGEPTFLASSLLTKLNSGDYSGASRVFALYNKVRKDGILVFSQPQAARREKERKLFIS